MWICFAPTFPSPIIINLRSPNQPITRPLQNTHCPDFLQKSTTPFGHTFRLTGIQPEAVA